ncbi:MAG: DNA polymerase III subunit gamma/tau, partial [bacterium]
MVFYRKYRPKNFSEVIGQEHIIKILTNALKADKVSHAYLFCGPRGTGKTTIARLLAKAVNCLNLKNAEPCNKCASCSEIIAGKAMDLIEIDAASHRGIDEIRELRDGIKFTPTRLKYKVFIIDEAHQLTKEAFNALLKTLEEPPEHVIFILATTEPHKVLPTIISRCQRLDFHKFSLDEIQKRLLEIAKQEKIKIESSALKLIAVISDGDLRDAISLLDQIISVEDKKITLHEVQTILGISDNKAIIDLVDCLIKKQSNKALKIINDLAQAGSDLHQFAKFLVNYFRQLTILKIDASLSGLAAPELTKEQLSVILEQGK